ncbi:MAG: diaminopimelate epimerase [Pseudonocardiales bacterium]|nr:diaminopimelate epimerase [Pseudonocardiales bacterium]MBV9029183.1 diaminopimelate epimerase [Pseudonocardiales bacterium]
MEQGIEFLKGHGTENDFVLLPDPTGRLDLTPSRVRALCDRHRGLGADGVLRAVPGALVPDSPPGTSPTDWFMDYRNADGSLAELCGNGARVFARYLADAGLVADPEFRIGSRSGPRAVRRNEDGSVTVEMGRVRREGMSTVTVEGVAFTGLVVDVGNPHLACLSEVPVEQLDLTVPPGHDPGAFPHGVNVEFVNVRSGGALRMRVHERGVGETRSCGTAAVAALAAALAARGGDTGETDVQMPGGLLHVAITDDGGTLTGPAVLLARGWLALDWWSAH